MEVSFGIGFKMRQEVNTMSFNRIKDESSFKIIQSLVNTSDLPVNAIEPRSYPIFELGKVRTVYSLTVYLHSSSFDSLFNEKCYQALKKSLISIFPELDEQLTPKEKVTKNREAYYAYKERFELYKKGGLFSKSLGKPLSFNAFLELCEKDLSSKDSKSTSLHYV